MTPLFPKEHDILGVGKVLVSTRRHGIGLVPRKQIPSTAPFLDEVVEQNRNLSLGAKEVGVDALHYPTEFVEHSHVKTVLDFREFLDVAGSMLLVDSSA